MPQTSNPFHGQFFSDEDAASIAALHRRAEHCKELGHKELAWSYASRASQIVNRAALKILPQDDIPFDTELFYIDIPAEYPGEVIKGKPVNLTLLLVEGSELTQKILKLLKEDDDGNGII